MSSRRSHAVVLAISVVLSLAAPGRGQEAESGRALGEGRYAVMEAKLERTLFRVPVLDLQMRFDEGAQERIAAAVERGGNRESIGDEVARAAASAERVHVRVLFNRRVPLARFIDEVRGDLVKAERAGMIDAAEHRRVREGLPEWFAVVEDRGLRKGDRLIYHAEPGSLRTQLVDTDGRVFLDVVHRGEAPPRTLLASFFAPETTFRASLVESVLD